MSRNLDPLPGREIPINLHFRLLDLLLHPPDLGDAALLGSVRQQLDLAEPVLEPLVDRFELAFDEFVVTELERVVRIDQAD